MDQRYYISLLVLLALVVVAWGIGPPTQRDVSQAPGNGQEDSGNLAVDPALQPKPPGQEQPPQDSNLGRLVDDAAGNKSRIPSNITESNVRQTSPLIPKPSPLASLSEPTKSSGPPGIGQRQPQRLPFTAMASGSPPDAGNSKIPSLAAGFSANNSENVAKQYQRIPGRNETSTLKAIEPRDDATVGRQPISESSASLISLKDLKPILKAKPANRSDTRPSVAPSHTRFGPLGPNNLKTRSPRVSDPLFRPLPSNNQQAATTHRFPIPGSRKTAQRNASGTMVTENPSNRGSQATGSIPKTRNGPRREYIWHVVSANESLESISLQYSGGDRMVRDVLQMNRDLIQDRKLLPVGTAIRIPVR